MAAIGQYPFIYPAEYSSGSLQIADILLKKIKLTLRETSNDFDDEIKSYIDAAAEDLNDAGIVKLYFIPTSSNWNCNARILQAIKLYALANYGLYNTDSEKYLKAYSSLKATLCTQRKYTELDYAVQ